MSGRQDGGTSYSGMDVTKLDRSLLETGTLIITPANSHFHRRYGEIWTWPALRDRSGVQSIGSNRGWEIVITTPPDYCLTAPGANVSLRSATPVFNEGSFRLVASESVHITYTDTGKASLETWHTRLYVVPEWWETAWAVATGACLDEIVASARDVTV